MEHTEVTGDLDGHGAYDERLPNVPMIIDETKPPENAGDTQSSKVVQTENFKTQTFQEYKKTNSRPNSQLPMAYVDLKRKCGTKEKVGAELAWLEKSPKSRPLLPSIRPVKRMTPEMKYSLVEMMNAQGFGRNNLVKENNLVKQNSTENVGNNR